MYKPHPNLARQLEIDAYERLLKRLANIPVNWDHTGRRSAPVLAAHGPDLRKVGRLIRQSRLLLDRTGVRKTEKPRPSSRWGVCGLCHKYKKLGPSMGEACPACQSH